MRLQTDPRSEALRSAGVPPAVLPADETFALLFADETSALPAAAERRLAGCTGAV